MRNITICRVFVIYVYQIKRHCEFVEINAKIYEIFIILFSSFKSQEIYSSSDTSMISIMVFQRVRGKCLGYMPLYWRVCARVRNDVWKVTKVGNNNKRFLLVLCGWNILIGAGESEKITSIKRKEYILLTPTTSRYFILACVLIRVCISHYF